MTVPASNIMEANLLKGDYDATAVSVTVEEIISKNPEIQRYAQTTL